MPPRPGSATLARRLGARVVALRLEAGLTQERLAWEAGLAKGYLSQVESGKRVPSVPVVFTLAAKLGVSAADVVGFDLALPELLLLDAARRVDVPTMTRATALVARGSTPLRRDNPVGVAPRETPLKGGVESVPLDLKVEVGGRVREGRIAAGLTQSGLAARLGATVNFVQRIESGTQNVTLDTLARLALAVGAPPAALLGAVRLGRSRSGRRRPPHGDLSAGTLMSLRAEIEDVGR